MRINRKEAFLALGALLCTVFAIVFTIDAFLSDNDALGWANLSAAMGWFVAFALRLERV